MELWKISTDVFDKEKIPFYGNKFLTGNGYFGLRGTMEEYTKENMCAVNMAGIYDRVGNSWRESVNAPNPLYTYIVINGKKYALPEVECASYKQELDFRNAIHTRETVWNVPEGKIIVRCERFASMSHNNLLAMKYSVMTDFACDAEIVTGVDGDVWDINGPHFVKHLVSDGCVKATTGENKIDVTAQQEVTALFDADKKYENTNMASLMHITFKAEANKEYAIEKIAAVSTSVDEHTFDNTALSVSYADCKAEHVKLWDNIWYNSEVEIDGDEKAMHALNYSIYHLNCIAPRNVSSRSIPARGLSGQVYKGAIFWDTEMFMIDYYLHTEPEIVKSILKYRIDTLPGAKVKAKEYGYEGAFYAWESQEDGIDACSSHNVTDVFTKRPMRTFFRDGQIHVCSAIVYAFDKYIKTTGDKSVLEMGGTTVIDECAKFYCSRLVKRYGSDLYEIHDVVGPDEYHERVNNNAYTNAMVKYTLEVAEKYTGNKEYLDAANKIFIKEPNENDIIEQFDGYFNLEDCSIDEVRSRLLDPTEYWGGAYGVASDTQVLKQADVVAMLGIFSDKYPVDILKKNWTYYEPRTEHGSSLSACMYSLLACRIGDAEFAYPLFMKSASADLVPGVKEWIGPQYIGGTHPAASGGAWKVAIQGFAGICEKDGMLCSEPCLPENWNGMRFKFLYKGERYQINITKKCGEIIKL